MQACDNVLKSVEVSLTSFQKDLGAVSAEIETLQSRSSALSTKLENRMVLEKLLGPAIEEITIAPSVVRLISDGPIDPSWMKALSELEKRSKTIHTQAEASVKTAAILDVKPVVDNLTTKVGIDMVLSTWTLAHLLSRQSNGYVTSTSLKSKGYDPRISMPR